MNSTENNSVAGPNPDVLASLRSQLQSLESSSKSNRQADRITSGWEALDSLLPTGGFLPGQLVEWLVDRPGHGGGMLALTVAHVATQRHNKMLVVVDRPESHDRHATFYPPAAVGLGINLRQLIVLRPRTAADEIWAMDQALRCPCVGAVWAWLPQLNDRDFRRFQLAAEEGESLGLLLRPASLRGQPTWADIQLLVETRPSTAPIQQPSPSHSRGSHPQLDEILRTGDTGRRRWQITVLRCRGGTAGKQRLLELDETNGNLREIHWVTNRETTCDWKTNRGATNEEKSPLPLAAQLAHPKNRAQTNHNGANRKGANRNSA